MPVVWDANAELVKEFSRKAGPADKQGYKQCRSNAEREAFRKDWDARYKATTNKRKRMVTTTVDRKSDWKRVRYLNWPCLIKAFGGEIDLEFAKGKAMTWVTKCERRGPPYMLWDNGPEMILYMYLELGSSDEFMRMRGEETSGDLPRDEPDDVLQEAAEEQQRLGLSHDMPEKAKLQFMSSASTPASAPSSVSSAPCSSGTSDLRSEPQSATPNNLPPTPYDSVAVQTIMKTEKDVVVNLPPTPHDSVAVQAIVKENGAVEKPAEDGLAVEKPAEKLAETAVVDVKKEKDVKIEKGLQQATLEPPLKQTKVRTPEQVAFVTATAAGKNSTRLSTMGCTYWHSQRLPSRNERRPQR